MNSPDPTVYLLQEPTSEKDLSSATKYGKIQSILTNSDRPSFNVPATLEKLKRALKNYRPGTDFICFAGGDPIVQFFAGFVIDQLEFDQVTYLVWNRERKNGSRTGEGFYFPKNIILRNKDTKYTDHGAEHE